VATQPGETDGYAVVDHVRSLAQHMGGLAIDRVLINSNFAPGATKIKPEWHVSVVDFTGLDEFESQVAVERRDVVNVDRPLRHDPDKLADVLIDIGRRRIADVGLNTDEARGVRPTPIQTPGQVLAGAVARERTVSAP
jgi:hypothetical protein